MASNQMALVKKVNRRWSEAVGRNLRAREDCRSLMNDQHRVEGEVEVRNELNFLQLRVSLRGSDNIFLKGAGGCF